jgi:ComF family protein
MLHSLVGIAFPNLCVGCNTALFGGEVFLCINCIHQFPESDFHLQPDNQLEKAFWGRVPLKRAFAFLMFKKKGIVQQLLHELKYGNQPDLGVFIGKLYGSKLKEAGFTFDGIVAIPLHAKKQKLRGYNQSDTFAQGLSEALGCNHLKTAIVRKKATTTQTNKSRFERWINVDEVFQVNEPELLLNKNILLVDDVITTGATIEACAQEILKHTPHLNVASIACVVHQ